MLDRYPVLMRLRFPDVLAATYPLTGIDVSHYQHTITWSSVASDGIDFAILKATEGQTYVDPTFAYNDSQAQLSGIPVGAYHVWTRRGKKRITSSRPSSQRSVTSSRSSTWR